MLYAILLVTQIIICLAMTGLILIQRSEGGALGIGSGPSGVMSARGAGNLLTKMTGILAACFFVICIALSIVGKHKQNSTSVIDQVGSKSITLDRSAIPALPQTPQDGASNAASSSNASSAPSLTQLGLPGPTPQVAQQAVPSSQSVPAASGQNRANQTVRTRTNEAAPAPSVSIDATQNRLKALEEKLKAATGSNAPPANNSGAADKSSAPEPAKP